MLFSKIRGLMLHIKKLKSKIEIEKRNVQILLFNINILLFIDNEKIEEFYSLIKNKYLNLEKKFYKNKLLKEKHWNYFNYLKSENDTKSYFETNNVYESLKLTINSFYKYIKKNSIFFKTMYSKINTTI